MGFYKLNNDHSISECSLFEAALPKKMMRTMFVHGSKIVTVSTVFLGVGFGFGTYPPKLFETMIFGGKLDDYQRRCSTWEDSLLEHERAVFEVQAEELSGNSEELTGS